MSKQKQLLNNFPGKFEKLSNGGVNLDNLTNNLQTPFCFFVIKYKNIFSHHKPFIVLSDTFNGYFTVKVINPHLVHRSSLVTWTIHVIRTTHGLVVT